MRHQNLILQRVVDLHIQGVIGRERIDEQIPIRRGADANRRQDGCIRGAFESILRRDPFLIESLAFLIDANSNEVITSELYVERARAAAEAGQPYNPRLAFQPVTAANETDYYDVDWTNLGPRLAATWNPPFESGSVAPSR